MTTVLLSLVVATSGLAAGGLLVSAIVGAPLLLKLPVEQYIPAHQFLVTRFDPFMPICIISSLLMSVILIFLSPEPVVAFCMAVSALLLLGAITVTLAKNVPVNKWIATVDPKNLPQPWSEFDRRRHWKNWNIVRTTCALLAFFINLTAVSLML